MRTAFEYNRYTTVQCREKRVAIGPEHAFCFHALAAPPYIHRFIELSPRHVLSRCDMALNPPNIA